MELTFPRSINFISRLIGGSRNDDNEVHNEANRVRKMSQMRVLMNLIHREKVSPMRLMIRLIHAGK